MPRPKLLSLTANSRWHQVATAPSSVSFHRQTCSAVFARCLKGLRESLGGLIWMIPSCRDSGLGCYWLIQQLKHSHGVSVLSVLRPPCQHSACPHFKCGWGGAPGEGAEHTWREEGGRTRRGEGGRTGRQDSYITTDTNASWLHTTQELKYRESTIFVESCRH